MTRERSLIQALTAIESALGFLNVAVESDETGVKALQYGEALREVKRSVDALVLAELLERGMTVQLRRVLTSLVESGEEFMEWEVLVEESCLMNRASLRGVMAQFIRREDRFRFMYWSGLFDESEPGLVRLEPHLLGVVRECLRAG